MTERFEQVPGVSAAADSQGDDSAEQRRSGADRRGQVDRRRSRRGLFERRARREGITDDRRQRDRREQAFVWLRSLFGFGERRSSDSSQV